MTNQADCCVPAAASRSVAFFKELEKSGNAKFHLAIIDHSTGQAMRATLTADDCAHLAEVMGHAARTLNLR